MTIVAITSFRFLALCMHTRRLHQKNETLEHKRPGAKKFMCGIRFWFFRDILNRLLTIWPDDVEALIDLAQLTEHTDAQVLLANLYFWSTIFRNLCHPMNMLRKFWQSEKKLRHRCFVINLFLLDFRCQPRWRITWGLYTWVLVTTRKRGSFLRKA